jgi:1-acyl-sn-glycerol-3-phosphate acyltransferase
VIFYAAEAPKRTMTVARKDLSASGAVARARCPRLARRTRGRLRAATRLLVLATLASGGELWCRLSAIRASDPHAAVLECLRRISALLIGALGMQVDRSGVPPAGLAVVVANHRSYVDIPLLLAHAPAVFLAKAEIGDWPLFGRLARRTRTVFVRREDAESRKQALERLGALLDEAVPIAVFPEGTTSCGPSVRAFRAGAFRLAAERGIGVVSVAIAYHDPDDAWVDDDDFVSHFLARFAAPRMRVSIRFGPVLRDRDGLVLAERARRWIAGELAELDASMAPRDRAEETAHEAAVERPVAALPL